MRLLFPHLPFFLLCICRSWFSIFLGNCHQNLIIAFKTYNALIWFWGCRNDRDDKVPPCKRWGSKEKGAKGLKAACCLPVVPVVTLWNVPLVLPVLLVLVLLLLVLLVLLLLVLLAAGDSLKCPSALTAFSRSRCRWWQSKWWWWNCSLCSEMTILVHHNMSQLVN